jgi:glycosyltransferase involved in cell wall biosynthesis
VTDARTFTVVVPTYRRPLALEACLNALAAVDYPRERFEVVVVDDGSPEPPVAVVEQAAAGLDARLVVQANAGPAAARNRGAAVARGDFLAFTDDDCRPASDWLTAMNGRLAGAPDDAVGGRTRNALVHNAYAATSHLIVDLVYAYYNRGPAGARFLASNNLALRAERFHAVGGFDESFPAAAAEDREFCARWLASGRRVVYAPEAVVSHAHSLDLRGFLKQHFNYGRGACRYHRAGAREGRGTLRHDLGFHLSLPGAAGVALRPVGTGVRAKMTTLLAVWEVANAAGYAWELLRRS